MRTASGKPMLASWMGGDGVAEGTAILNTAGIPTFSYPDTAARAFTYMWRYTYNLRGLYETPALVEAAAMLRTRAPRSIEFDAARAQQPAAPCSTSSKRSNFSPSTAFR